MRFSQRHCDDDRDAVDDRDVPDVRDEDADGCDYDCDDASGAVDVRGDDADDGRDNERCEDGDGDD